MRKIRRYTEWQSVPYKEKAQYGEFQKIMIYAQNAGISKKIVDDAIKYHKKISEYEHSFRGDNKNGLLIASIYISFRINEFPRTAKELAVMFNLDVAIATKGCKIAMAILNDLENEINTTMQIHFCQNRKRKFNAIKYSNFNRRRNCILCCPLMQFKYNQK